MTIIVLSIVISVLFLYSVFMSILFFVTEKQYAKYFRAIEEELEETEANSQETISGLRALLRLLREFKDHAFSITKKYDLINHPDFIHFQKQLASLCEVIDLILSNEGGEIDEEADVPEERRKINKTKKA